MEMECDWTACTFRLSYVVAYLLHKKERFFPGAAFCNEQATILPDEPMSAHDLSDGRAWIDKAGTWGFIDEL